MDQVRAARLLCAGLYAAPAGAGSDAGRGSFAGASLASRCGVGRSRDCCCCCGRGCGGGAWVTGPLPLAGDGVSEPDECRFEGVPSNRGISSGVTTSTTTASGGGAWKAFAPTKNKPTIRAARWPMTETASPWRTRRSSSVFHPRRLIPHFLSFSSTCENVVTTRLDPVSPDRRLRSHYATAPTRPDGSPVFARAGKTEPPSRLVLSQTSAD